MTIPPALLHAFQTLHAYIEAARAIVRAGQTPDMMGLDHRVSQLCTSIAASDQETQQECLPKLNELLQKLDACEADIRAARSPEKKEGSPND
jgi:mannitol/fructose-specific phosphotransferase system IIA component (Ntr-type)